MLFAVPSGKDLKKDEVDQEYIAITGNGRVLMKTPTLEVDEALSISKALIHRTDSLFLRNDLQDMGIYIMSYWVHVLPYLILSCSPNTTASFQMMFQGD